MKFDKIPCKVMGFSTMDKFGKLIPVKLRVMHDKINRNKSAIEFDVMEKARESIKNVPIVAYINYDEDGDAEDFGGHEVDMKLVQSKNGFDIVKRYREYPVGIIPESTNVSYEAIDGKMYLSCTGYLFEGYSNETVDLLSETDGKCVSMEISVNDGYYNKEDEVYQITDFCFRAITILGDDITPGMDENCRIDFLTDEDYSMMINKYNEEKFSLEGEVKSLEKEIVEEVVEEVVETEAIEPIEEVKEDEVQVEDNETVEVPIEEVKEPEIEENEVEEVETKEFSLEMFKLLFEEVPASLEEIAVKLNERFEVMEVELEQLRRFKLEKDKEELANKVENIVAEFSTLEASEIEDVKNKALAYEIELDEFRKELFCLVGMKALANKENFSANEVVEEVRIMDTQIKSEKTDVYGGLINKYKK